MRRVRLIHWNAGEAVERAERLHAAGYRVESEPLTPAVLRALRADPPDAVVIDLSRLPAQGRDLGVALRRSKSTRRVPLVFVGGSRAKVAGVKQHLPDAAYGDWRGIRSTLRRAIAHPPTDPVKPASALAAYSGTPLPKKLGIKPGSVVALVGAPEGFEELLGELPEGVTLRPRAQGRCDLIVWFAAARRELERRVARLGAVAGAGGLWIAWPKKTSGVVTDLSERVVREAGLAAGLVDYKIAAIDETWSGLRFARRKRG